MENSNLTAHIRDRDRSSKHLFTLTKGVKNVKK